MDRIDIQQTGLNDWDFTLHLDPQHEVHAVAYNWQFCPYCGAEVTWRLGERKKCVECGFVLILKTTPELAEFDRVSRDTRTRQGRV